MGESRQPARRPETRDEASDAPSGDQPPDPDPGPGRPSTRRTPTLELRIDDDAGALAPPAMAWLRDAAERALLEALRRRGAPGAGHAVRLRIVGDEEMSALHAAHTGDASTTDVLTFDLRDAPETPLDADVVLCADEALRQATRRGRPVERELLLYALHGALHCLGCDDHDDEAYEAMHALEDEILKAVGVGATFHDPTESGAVADALRGGAS